MKIKKNYVKVKQRPWFNPWKGCFEDRYSQKYIGGYWIQYYLGADRNIQTFNERKQNHWAKCDGIVVRGNRRHLPHSWDDPRRAREWGRSWKDYTKRKKQWDK